MDDYVELRDAGALLGRTRQELKHLGRIYAENLEAQDISDELRVTVKGVLDHQRSVVDYAAGAVHVALTGTPPDRSIGFPLAASEPDFQGRLAVTFPGLAARYPTVEGHWRGLQEYSDPTSWAVRLNSLANENKHRRLSAQTRAETRGVRIVDRSGGVVETRGDVRFDKGTLSIGAGGSISIGGSGHIAIGNDAISVLGAVIDPRTQLPQPGSAVRVSRLVWVSVQFANGDGVVQTLERIQQGCEELVKVTREALAG